MQVAYGKKEYRRFLELFELLVLQCLKNDELNRVKTQKKRASIFKYFTTEKSSHSKK
jgi:hypothetical protein